MVRQRPQLSDLVFYLMELSRSNLWELAMSSQLFSRMTERCFMDRCYLSSCILLVILLSWKETMSQSCLAYFSKFLACTISSSSHWFFLLRASFSLLRLKFFSCNFLFYLQRVLIFSFSSLSSSARVQSLWMSCSWSFLRLVSYSLYFSPYRMVQEFFWRRSMSFLFLLCSLETSSFLSSLSGALCFSRMADHHLSLMAQVSTSCCNFLICSTSNSSLSSFSSSNSCRLSISSSMISNCWRNLSSFSCFCSSLCQQSFFMFSQTSFLTDFGAVSSFFCISKYLVYIWLQCYWRWLSSSSLRCDSMANSARHFWVQRLMLSIYQTCLAIVSEFYLSFRSSFITYSSNFYFSFLSLLFQFFAFQSSPLVSLSERKYLLRLAFKPSISFFKVATYHQSCAFVRSRPSASSFLLVESSSFFRSQSLLASAQIISVSLCDSVAERALQRFSVSDK